MNLHQNENTESLSMPLHQNSHGWLPSTHRARYGNDIEGTALASPVSSPTSLMIRSPPRTKYQGGGGGEEQQGKQGLTKRFSPVGDITKVSMPTINEDDVTVPSTIPATSQTSSSSVSTVTTSSNSSSSASSRYPSKMKKVKRKRAFIYQPSPSLNMALPYPTTIDGKLVPDSRWRNLGRRSSDDVPPRKPSRAVVVIASDNQHENAPDTTVENDVKSQGNKDEEAAAAREEEMKLFNEETIKKLEESLRYIHMMTTHDNEKKRRKLVVVPPSPPSVNGSTHLDSRRTNLHHMQLVYRSRSALACLQSTTTATTKSSSSSSSKTCRGEEACLRRLDEFQNPFRQKSWYSF